ncbi:MULTISPECIES: FtsW/RodA/SpoVE family cell cycle protein [Pedobacter]|uniref:Probable peptidoglycan glycosyltransferase FtsW n=1 Tax=Pedobacter heparinus (strain ATCC 13125 / DSM 2366 / CIP 104194 / JCM 7457 / NBRC 12017 / NCIMB 9290 / NRRL B-14731 / HIM 762-3) TaxID=485917 RepID=C6Y478_PEDHD|nr:MULTISPECIES: FtsW/RodA/SpoVE family cell cycle protein [Pedobacter]ACU05521.1 cell cycle protein [Pedobacter heparinus DSM 2366]MBB5440515.1 cell division protein FtsW [Pedobacter sp. AK017]
MIAINTILDKTKGDRWIWLIIILLSMISILTVYSATGAIAYKKGVTVERYLLYKHVIFVILGIGMIYIAHLLDYKYYAGISKILMIITIPLLFYTAAFGEHINDASRWVKIPVIGLTFQTSDLAKLALITFLARMLTRKQENIKDVKKAFIPIMGSVCVVFALIAWANLSTALMLFGVSILLLIIGRISIKQILMVCAGGSVLLLFIVFLGPRAATYESRIKSFLHPEQQHSDKTYQADQSKIALATGGFFGKGPGNSTQRNFLPHPYSDFIFSIIVEEYGVIGAVMMIVLYLVLLYRCVRIVTQSPKAFGALLAAGLSFSLTIQAFANMAVAVGLGPVTGVPLPLVSMGGTSILFTSIAFGIILSVSRDVEEKGSKKVIVGEIPAMA